MPKEKLIFLWLAWSLLTLFYHAFVACFHILFIDLVWTKASVRNKTSRQRHTFVEKSHFFLVQGKFSAKFDKCEMNPNQVKFGKELKIVQESVKLSIPGIDDGHDNLNDELPSCRICFGTSSDDSDLIQPCLCKGTLAKVHRKCLERWLNLRRTTKCELCRFELHCCQKLRYGLFESIGIWFRRHQYQQRLLQDLSLFFAITIIALSMIIMLLRNMFTRSAAPLLYFALLGLTLLMWIGIFFTLCFIIVIALIRPWYRWWKSKKRIQLAVNWLACVFTHNKNYLHTYNFLCVSINLLLAIYRCTRVVLAFICIKTYGPIACGHPALFHVMLCVTDLWFQGGKPFALAAFF